MFTITSTRIVGLIAVVCAAIVAPQALATPIIDSQNATPTIIAPPGRQGYDLSGFDPSVLNGIRGHSSSRVLERSCVGCARGRHDQERQGSARVAMADPAVQPANKTTGGLVRPSPRAARRLPRPPRSRLFSVEALPWTRRTGSCIRARTGRRLRRAPTRQCGVPACSPNAAAEYDSYLYSGDPCTI